MEPAARPLRTHIVGRALPDSAWDDYAALSPDDQGQGALSADAILREACWSDERLARAMECGITAWGWRHKGWTERDIRDEAKHRIATLWRAGRSLWASSYKARYGVAPTPLMRLDPTAALRGERRNMRRCVRQAEEATALLAGQVGSRGHQARYASRCARSRRADQLEQHQRLMDETLVVDTETGEAIPLAKVARQPRQRRAELHVVTRGMIDYEIAQGRWPYFVTLTLLASWHPSPKFGRAKWDGSLPVAGQRELRHRWALARARAKKAGIDLVGGRFVEPHSDGCVHWHLIQFMRDDEVQRVTDILTAVFGDLGPAVRIERARSAEGAVKYCMAYSAKTAVCGAGKIGQHITGDDLSGVDSWRATWGIRGWQLFGLKGRLGVWRECRRTLPINAPPELHALAAHARKGDFRAFHEAAEMADARIATVTEKREFPHPDPEVHAEVKAGQAQAERQLRRLAAEHGVPVGPDTPPADLAAPLLEVLGDDPDLVREVHEAESALTRRAVVTVPRHRTVGVHLDAHGFCVTTRTRRWVLIRAEDSAAASAAALAASGITVTADSGSQRTQRRTIPAAQAPPNDPVIQPQPLRGDLH